MSVFSYGSEESVWTKSVSQTKRFIDYKINFFYFFFFVIGFGVGGKNPERVGRDKTKTLKQKNRKVGVLSEQIRHGMIKWEKNYKGQPASDRGLDLDNSSEGLGKSLRTPEEMVLCPVPCRHCILMCPHTTFNLPTGYKHPPKGSLPLIWGNAWSV